MRTELSSVSGHTARVVPVPITGAPTGEGPVTWGQWAIRAAMLDMEPDDHGTNIRVLHPIAPAVAPKTALTAVRGLLSVYDSLRTRIVIGDDKTMRQHLDSEGTHDVCVFEAEDADAADALARQIEKQWHAVSFAYDREWPIRTALIQVDGRIVHAVMVLSHIASDALGLSLVHRTFAALLDGADPAVLRKDSPGFQPLAEAAYQASEKGRKRDEAARRHWRQALRDCPERLFERREGAAPEFRQAVLASPPLPAALEVLSDRWQVPSSAILLAAASTVMARQSGSDRCVLQVMVSNRFLPHLRETVSPITLEGLFIVDVGEDGFEAVARRAARSAMKTYYHAYYDKAVLNEDLRKDAGERGAGADLTCWYNDLRDMTARTRTTDVREHQAGRVTESFIEWGERLGAQSQTSLAWHMYSSAHLMPLTLTVDTSLIDEAATEAMLYGFESLIVDAAAATTAVTP
ncbi:condensation domain-containing protein [Streptomyces sp. NPDC051940]|uniref:condensation domain-containing protein n=1 Tax=Streptomyces sp. NPDC051940 TaxID=3155675 RepID=UPI0034355E9F